MKVFALCERCGDKGEPSWDPGTTGMNMQAYGAWSAGKWTPPGGWLYLDTHLFCNPCATMVREAMLAAMKR